MRIEIEWEEEAPGVRDVVLAATWARMEIHVGDQCLTEGTLGSGVVRKSIYGSVLPLTAWLLDHWWNLLYEPRPVFLPSVHRVTRRNAAWLRRHSLTVAKEGFVLPDCLIYSDEDYIRFEWNPDHLLPGQRIRFIGHGVAAVRRQEVVEYLSTFIKRVLVKLEDTLGSREVYDFEDCRHLFSSWDAIQKANGKERGFCKLIGTVGLDPYDPDGTSDALFEAVDGMIRFLPEEIGEALAAGSTAETLAGNYKWVQPLYDEYHNLEGLGQCGPDSRFKPFEVGYIQARSLRKELGNPIGPIEDLQCLLNEHWPGGLTVSNCPAEKIDIQGFLGQVPGAQRVLTLPQGASQTAVRFALARAAFLTLARDGIGPPALLTEATTWSQQASRAFGAELLAPACALDRRIGTPRVTEEQIGELALEFRVNPMLIRHQIENHDLASIVT